MQQSLKTRFTPSPTETRGQWKWIHLAPNRWALEMKHDTKPSDVHVSLELSRVEGKTVAWWAVWGRRRARLEQVVGQA